MTQSQQSSQSSNDINGNATATNSAQQTAASNAVKREEQVKGVLKDGRMFETVYDDQQAHPVQFIVREKDGSLNRQQSILSGYQSIQPPQGKTKLIKKNALLFASDAAAYSSELELLREVKVYIHKYADLTKFEIEVLAHYAMMTWVHDKFSAVPYLRFLGEPGTGKTRLLEILQQLSYRGIMFGPGSSVSPLFRLQDVMHGTILFDEADFNKSDMQSDIIKILNGGYTKGSGVMRAGSSDDNFEPETFDVYGPKVIANRNRFDDRALETRCLTFQTVEKRIRPDVPKQLLEGHEFYLEGQQLRNKLLMWRFDRYHTIEVDESAFTGLSGRQAQIATPIYSISPDPAFKARFLQHMTEQDAYLKEENPSLIVLEVLAAYSDMGHESVLTKLVSAKVRQLAAKREISAYDLQERRVNSLAASLGVVRKKTNAGQSLVLDRAVLSEARGRYRREKLHDDVEAVMSDVGSLSGSLQLRASGGLSSGLLPAAN